MSIFSPLKGAPRFTFQETPQGAVRRRAPGLVSVTGGIGVVLIGIALRRARAASLVTAAN